MKKAILLLTAIIALSLMSNFVIADNARCDINASLVSQDPYPATPGDYVKLVFQLSGAGISDASCGKIRVELIDEFPISFDSGDSNKVEAQSGIYISDYNSYLIAPFKVRVDKSALAGGNSIKLRYSVGTDLVSYTEKEFNLEVQDTETDFEVSVKDYDYTTQIITFEILNVGKNNVESLVAEMPVQGNIEIKGSRRNIIGSLDSNDDTTFTFEATPKDGQISMILLYNDDAGVRRQVEKSVMFNSADFQDRVADKKGTSGWVYVVILVVIVAAVYFWRRNKKKKDLLKRKF